MIDQSFDTEGPLRLDLRIPGGRIDIEAGGTGPAEVRLEGPELDERATVELRGDELRVHVRDRKGFFVDFGREEYILRVRCPAGSSLHVRTKSADVETHGPLGTVRCEGASGDTTIESAQSVHVQSASGDIVVHEATAEVEAGTASGNVEIGRAARVVANVVSGDLRVRDVEGSVSATSVSGDVRLDGVVSGDVSVQAVSGDVHVGVRRGSLVYVDASTLSGDTRSELDLDTAPAADEGGPRVELQLKTVSGDITVARAPAATPQEV